MSGWDGLLSILREAAQTAAAERDAPLAACPVDGEPLKTGPDGGLFCPWDSNHPTTNRGW